MECNNYEAAINALLKENKGMLPSLTTYIGVALSSALPSMPVCSTVAELLALTLAEISTSEALMAEPVLSEVAVAAGVKVKVPTEELPCGSYSVALADLLEWAIVSVN